MGLSLMGFSLNINFGSIGSSKLMVLVVATILIVIVRFKEGAFSSLKDVISTNLFGDKENKYKEKDTKNWFGENREYEPKWFGKE